MATANEYEQEIRKYHHYGFEKLWDE